MASWAHPRKERDRRRWARALGGMTAGGLALLLPWAGAAPSLGTIVTPPYVGASAAATNFLHAHGCVLANQVPAVWYATNGSGTFRENASGGPCPNSSPNGSTNGGTATGGFLVSIPAPGGLSGLHQVVVHWRPALGFGVHLALGRCHAGNGSWSCAEVVRVSITAVALVHDVTNGTSIPASNRLSWSVEVGALIRCSPACRVTNLSVPALPVGPVALFLNATFNASHSYVIATTWLATAEVSFVATHTVLTGASGRASVNAERPHSVELSRITIR